MAPARLAEEGLPIAGTRNLSDNLSDLKAQVAANTKGISLVSDLIREYSLPVVQSYMKFIQVGYGSAFYFSPVPPEGSTILHEICPC